MKNRRDRKLTRDLLKALDVSNTLNGGISQPQIHKKVEKDRIVINIKVPGVALESLKVEVVNQHLLVYHEMELEQGEELLTIPHVIVMFPLGVQIDFARIYAEVDNEFIRVTLPFSEFANGYQRVVEIRPS